MNLYILSYYYYKDLFIELEDGAVIVRRLIITLIPSFDFPALFQLAMLYLSRMVTIWQRVLSWEDNKVHKYQDLVSSRCVPPFIIPVSDKSNFPSAPGYCE